MRRRLAIILMILLFLLGTLHAAMAQSRSGVMVWRLEAKEGVSEHHIDSLTGIVAAEVDRYSGMQVVSEADIRTILQGEEVRQRCGEESTSCMVSIGAALGVPEAVSGDLGRIGSIWVLNLRRINIRSTEVAGRVSRQVDGTVEDLVKVVPAAVAELFGKQAPELPATLSVTTKPDAAEIRINGQSVGQAPVKKNVPAGDVTVQAEKKGYELISRTLTLEAGQSETLQLEMTRYPMNPYKLGGHIAFWSGLGLAVIGGIATWQAYDTAGDNKNGDWGDKSGNKAWSGAASACYAIGGAAMITGVVLWAISPGDEAWAEKHRVSMGVSPDGKGLALSWQGSF